MIENLIYVIIKFLNNLIYVINQDCLTKFIIMKIVSSIYIYNLSEKEKCQNL